MLVEDDYADSYSDFVTLVQSHHGYPATNVQWQPASASSFNWSQKAGISELLASTGDALRVWEYTSDASPAMSSISGYVGRQSTNDGHRLTLRAALSGVRLVHMHLAGILFRHRWNPRRVHNQSLEGALVRGKLHQQRAGLYYGRRLCSLFLSWDSRLAKRSVHHDSRAIISVTYISIF